MIVKGGEDKEGVLKRPVIQNKGTERGCRMRGRDLKNTGDSWSTVHDQDCSAKGNSLGSMEILYNQ